MLTVLFVMFVIFVALAVVGLYCFAWERCLLNRESSH
jgi:hypothetical protein